MLSAKSFTYLSPSPLITPFTLLNLASSNTPHGPRTRHPVLCDCDPCKHSDPAGRGQLVPSSTRADHIRSQKIYASAIAQRGRATAIRTLTPTLVRSIQARGRGIPSGTHHILSQSRATPGPTQAVQLQPSMCLSYFKLVLCLFHLKFSHSTVPTSHRDEIVDVNMQIQDFHERTGRNSPIYHFPDSPISDGDESLSSSHSPLEPPASIPHDECKKYYCLPLKRFLNVYLSSDTCRYCHIR